MTESQAFQTNKALTVGELIDKLKRYPQDLEVITEWNVKMLSWKAITGVNGPCNSVDPDRAQAAVLLLVGEEV